VFRSAWGGDECLVSDMAGGGGTASGANRLSLPGQQGMWLRVERSRQKLTVNAVQQTGAPMMACLAPTGTGRVEWRVLFCSASVQF
jgi:regulation of enolase protein 1 (concanavalin A-like superfamily)